MRGTPEAESLPATASERESKMDERRKTERVPAERSSSTSRSIKTAIFGVTNLETDRLMGHMTDITPVGLQMTTFKPVEVRSIFNFRLRLPEPIQGSIFIIMDAECLWCKQGTDAKSYIAGFKLNAITPGNVKRVQTLMTSLGLSKEAVAD